jgi:bacterioferritin-associated ferredoxin
MYVCICRAVSDQDIKEAVANGAEDLADIEARLGVTTGCGTCTDFANEIISEALMQKLTYAA